eukprot:jgi/Ulvmu1/1248/UM109_0046.1
MNRPKGPRNGGRTAGGGDSKRERSQGHIRTAEDIRLSKRMSRTLRHHPPSCMDGSGWVPIHELVSHIGIAQSEEQILRVVSTDEKGRFEVDNNHAPPRIRATQGHSVALEAPVLRSVTQESEAPIAVHLTSPDTWQAIQQDGFLRRMARTHIHFATKPVLARKNKWANTYLRLNVQQTIDDGVPLYLSSNEVLLVEGPLPIKYVTEVAAFPASPDDGGNANAP